MDTHRILWTTPLIGALVVALFLAKADPRPPSATPSLALAAEARDSILWLPAVLRFADRLDRPPPVTPVPASATPTPSMSPTVAPSASPTSTLEPTESPTEEPTAPPTATASPTEEPAPPLQCQELLSNGDFEARATGWTLTVTTATQDANRAILHSSKSPVPTFDGNYLAWLGGLDATRFTFRSSALARVEAARVVSATLRIHSAILSDETPDHRANDVAMVALENAQGRHVIDDLTLSEEDMPVKGRWYRFDADITELVRAGAPRKIELRVDTDRERTSWIHFDGIAVRACLTPR